MLGDLEVGGAERDRRQHHAVDLAAQNALVAAGHADVALKRGPAGKHLFVGRRHVGVGAQHRGDASVEIASHELFVAGGFGVEVEHADGDVAGDFRQHVVGAVQGQSTGRMKSRPSRLNTATSTPLAAGDDDPVATGRGPREVGRFDDVGVRRPGSCRFRCAGRCGRPA